MYTTKSKILPLNLMKSRVKSWRVNQELVVFTNGCFDILHPGHIDCLEKARAMGNRLIVGVNSDASVSRLKGPSRPIQDEHARASVLAALEFVDGVVIFEEDTPLNLIVNIMPDVLVKGGDYSIETIVGHKEVLAHGGKVETIPFLEGHSTTKIVERIRQ